MNDLTQIEVHLLGQYEAKIEFGLATFVEVGTALLAIRDGRLYRQKYQTFENYCRKRWGMSRIHAHRLIDAAEISSNLLPIGNIPQTESQTRPLTALPPEQQREAWQQAIETAPNGKITAAHVQGVVYQQILEANRQGAAIKVPPAHPMKPKENRSGDIYEPAGYDNCQTPPYAIDPLLPYLVFPTVWEPATGEGYLVGALYDAGFKETRVVATDILGGHNFFEYEPDRWDCIVTNPPYSIKYKWLERCYALGRPFALLLPVETLGSGTAQAMFEKFGIEILLLNRRVNFKMPNRGWNGSGAQFPVAWFCWQLLDAPIQFGRIEYEPVGG